MSVYQQRRQSRPVSLYEQFGNISLSQPPSSANPVGVKRQSQILNFQIPQQQSSQPQVIQQTISQPPIQPPVVEYNNFDKELYVYLTNPANSAEYEAAYDELLLEVTDFLNKEKVFNVPKLTCGAAGEEYVEWRDVFLSYTGPLARAMINMSGEDEEAQDDQLELIEKIMADKSRPDYAEYLRTQGTYKYVCLVRDYNALLLKLISENVSNTLFSLFASTKSAAVAYNFLKTRFSAKIWTKSIYQMATIPTPPGLHLEQFRLLKSGILEARKVQPCEVPAMEFSFILEFLRSRRDIRDHQAVHDLYQRNLTQFRNKQNMLKQEIDRLLLAIEDAVLETTEESVIAATLNVQANGDGVSPVTPTSVTSFESLTKKVRTRGRRRRSVMVKKAPE